MMKVFFFKSIPFVLTLFVAILFSTCKKETTEPTESFPQTFTKKVLIEEITGEWCPACADAFNGIPGYDEFLSNYCNWRRCSQRRFFLPLLKLIPFVHFTILLLFLLHW